MAEQVTENSPMRIAGVAGVSALVGSHLGYSGWHEVTQSDVDDFARITKDHQWIHVDEERAAAGPFGTRIAHGFLTLSLVSAFAAEVFAVDGLAMGINYGMNKVRFLAPVPVGSRLRGGFELKDLTPQGEGAYLMTALVTIEIEGETRPACVVESLSLLVEEKS